MKKEYMRGILFALAFAVPAWLLGRVTRDFSYGKEVKTQS